MIDLGFGTTIVAPPGLQLEQPAESLTRFGNDTTQVAVSVQARPAGERTAAFFHLFEHSAALPTGTVTFSRSLPSPPLTAGNVTIEVTDVQYLMFDPDQYGGFGDGGTMIALIRSDGLSAMYIVSGPRGQTENGLKDFQQTLLSAPSLGDAVPRPAPKPFRLTPSGTTVAIDDTAGFTVAPGFHILGPGSVASDDLYIHFAMIKFPAPSAADALSIGEHDLLAASSSSHRTSGPRVTTSGSVVGASESYSGQLQNDLPFFGSIDMSFDRTTGNAIVILQRSDVSLDEMSIAPLQDEMLFMLFSAQLSYTDIP